LNLFKQQFNIKENYILQLFKIDLLLANKTTKTPNYFLYIFNFSYYFQILYS